MVEISPEQVQTVMGYVGAGGLAAWKLWAANKKAAAPAPAPVMPQPPIPPSPGGPSLQDTNARVDRLQIEVGELRCDHQKMHEENQEKQRELLDEVRYQRRRMDQFFEAAR